MSGKKRLKPYMVRIKVGNKINEEKGTCYPNYKIIGYAKSRKEGILMLQKYHDNPYDLENTMTFEQVYEATMKEFVEHKSRSSINVNIEMYIFDHIRMYILLFIHNHHNNP